MSITNLGELKTAVRRYLKRTDLDDLIPDWISFAGKRIDNDLRLPDQEFRTTATANAKYLPLPFDFIEMRNIQVNFMGDFALEYVTPGQADRVGRKISGTPIQFYTIFNNQIELIPPPSEDSLVEIELFYYAQLPTLVNDSDTNKVLVAYPQMYLYCCMIEAMPFLEHDKGQVEWQAMYNTFKDAINDRAQAGRFSGNSIAMRSA